jgi:ATP-binding cassette, subfamily B, multidrug efflux pump
VEKIVKRLLAYLKPHSKELSLAFLFLLMATAADVAGPVLIKQFIDKFLVPLKLELKPVFLLGFSYLGLIVLASTLHYFQLVRFNRIALKVIQQLRVEVFAKVQHLGLAFFDKTPAGSLVSKITNDTEAIKDLFVSVLSTFIQSIVFFTGVFIAMFSINANLATLCLMLLPIILFLMHLYRKLSSKVYRVLRKKLSQINAQLNESLQGMNIIQVMGQQKRLRDEFGQTNHDYYLASLQNIRLSSLLLRPAVDLIYTLSLVLVLSFFGIKSLSGAITIGTLYAFINYLERFFEPVNMIMMRLSQLQQALVAAERVFELLDEKLVAPPQVGCEQPVIKEGLVEFKNVSFSYDGKVEVLKNISFTAYPGQTVALVGHTGSGKSSIINLLMRFYPTNCGDIEIDGVSVTKYSKEELRAKLGLVLQEPFLFVGDISQNISLHNQRLSQQDIINAAEFVQADEFIRKLPRGYLEPIGERGATFSSGQRQLLSFARTIAANPKILILDEATASIDTETEEGIQEALSKMRKGRTTLAIAHRLSTIQDADIILVLHKGRIVERGTHQELLVLEGLYHKMFLLQQGFSLKSKMPVF